MVKGFVPRHTYTLTGDTNVGKTSLACFFAVNVAKQGKSVLYMALEPHTGVVEYMASVLSGKQFSELDPSVDYKFAHLPIKLYTKDQIRTVDQLLSVLKGETRYDVVIIDHIGYFVNNTLNPNQEQANVMKKLAEISTTRNTSVLAIAHLNKGAKLGKIPTLNDISGSKAFTQDATDVWILYKELDPRDKTKSQYLNTGHLIVAKSKNSASGPIAINFGVKRAGVTEISNIPEIYRPQEPEEREVTVPREKDTVQMALDAFK
jgi:replicative DNA helicase